MRDIRFRYIIKRKNGHIFSEIFPLKDIENGYVKSWFKNNCIGGDDEVIIEQYTGLKDKKRNLTEVYEGDIYTWCGLTLPITVDDFHGYRFMFGKDQLVRAFIENGKYHGNIHDNPKA